MTRLLWFLALVLLSRVAVTDPLIEPQTPGRIDFVIVVSVDGLRSDALLAPSVGSLPAFERLREGSSTLNARTLVKSTVTLPNHVGMVTGRLMEGPGGHGWTANDLTPSRLAGTVHDTAGATIESVFDVAQRHGVFTGVVVSKPKLRLLPFSWSSIDVFSDVSEQYIEKTAQTEAVTRDALRLIGGEPQRGLLFVHYAEPDHSGHTFGWDLTIGSPYLQSIASIDRQLERIMQAIDGDERRAGRTAIVVTSDHGGGGPHRSHLRDDLWVNYIIPFLVWCGDEPAAELYALNGVTRRDPGIRQPAADDPRPPVRNADAANVALSLLGLPPVPGSTVNADQDLRILLPSVP